MSSDGWEEVRLIDLAVYQNGRATKPAESRSAGLPVVKIRELTGGITESTVRVDPESVEQRHLINSGDLLFAWSASLGIYRWIGGKAALNQHIFRVTARDGTDQGFLRYLLEYQLRWLIATAAERQTTMGHVRKADLERLTCKRPPLDEQRAIAEVLGSLDERIEWAGTLRRVVLELLVTVFQHGATEHRRVEDVAAVIPGQSPPGSTYNDAGLGLPFYQGSAQFGPLIPQVEKWCSEPQRVAEAGDILFSVRAPVGDLNVAEEQCCIGRGVAAIRSHYRAALYAALRSATGEWSIHDSSGTVFGSITGRSLREARISWPPDVDALSPILEALLDSAMAAEGEAKVLQAARAALLPKLVSGEMRIEDPERLLDQVA